MERHLLAAAIGFALGILAEAFLELSWPGAAYAGFMAALVAALYAWRRLSIFLLAAMLLLGAALGMARTELQPMGLPAELAGLIGTEARIEGVVIADPDLRETTQRLTVEVREGEATARVLVVAPLHPPVRYGETVRAEGEIQLPEPFDTDAGRTFAYDKFLAKDGVFAVMEEARVEVAAPRNGILAHARGMLSDMKFGGIDALSVALPEPAASLASGLILGGKQGLGAELLDDFIRSGLVHIVALSGYNVMIVADFVMRAFGFLTKGTAAGLGGVTIALFVLAAGAGPASVRAGIMAAIALYARATGRIYAALHALLLAGALMLLWNPLTLPYDPGFQLSFLATLGLIFGAPVTERWLSFVKSAFMREVASSTLAAQIAVLPLLLYQNGLFSVVALPANLLVLPLVPLAMLTSLVALLAGLLAPLAAPALGLPALVLLSYILGAVEVASGLPLAAFTVPAFPFVFVLAAYAALGCYVAASRKRFSATDQLRFPRKAST